MRILLLMMALVLTFSASAEAGWLDDKLKQAAEMKAGASPGVTVYYPREARIPRPAWTGLLGPDTGKQIADSPARKKLETMLDFGCGCGRILRWWASLKDSCEIWGCDYNADLIAWCQRRLSYFAQFKVTNHG